jgi:hypothetical protein
MEEEGIDYVFLGHNEFLGFNHSQLSVFLDAEFGIVYSKGEALVLGFDSEGASLEEAARDSVEVAESRLAGKVPEGSGDVDSLMKSSQDNLDAAMLSFSSGDFGGSLVFSKKSMAELNEAGIVSGESSVRSYINNPSGLVVSFLIGLAYYLLLVVLITLHIPKESVKDERKKHS